MHGVGYGATLRDASETANTAAQETGPVRCSFFYLDGHNGLIDVSLSLLSLPPVARGGIRRVLDAYT
jgi:hypothetical protein